MAARYKYQEWLQPEKLEQITNWAANGLGEQQLAQSMGIHRDTLHTWKNKFADISDAIKKGRQLAVQCIENQFFKNAYGMLEETTEIVEEDQEFDGKNWVPVKRHVRRTTRKIPPNTAAQIFFLKNKAGYRDNPEESQEIEDTEAFFSEAGFLS